MKSLLWRMTLKLKRKPYWIQMCIFFVSSFLIVLSVIPFIALSFVLEGESTEGPDSSSWFLIIILVPILETFIHQHLPFKLMQNWSWAKNKYGLYILVSAIVFGLVHTYSFQYIIFAFSVGLILAYMYFFYSKNPRISFWSTTLIHALRNLIAFLAALKL
ncbi:MAG: CPBP family intramembrane metalloprotease [Prolixibacteraceae bacterium]|nr:CPBP family intramembrane metalloprotease [Prolixibacteraceae bacterium]